MTTPQPGDFAVVTAGGLGGPLINWAERLNGAAPQYAAYQHAFIYIGDRHAEIVQAEPAGAAIAHLTPHGKTLWSTGKIPLTEAQRHVICQKAFGYVGTPYSFLDYVAIALHHWHVPAPGLKAYVASTRHMICSQLVDQCYQDAGVHLFQDGRWPGFVTPADLAQLLEDKP